MVKDKENETELTFTSKQAKQIKDLFWKDKEFKNTYLKIRNAWLLQKISVKDAVRLIKEAIEKD